MELRVLGRSGLRVSAVGMGCWPISGMTSVDVREEASLATLRACPDLGINFLDTAYCYGAQGESERLIARALGHRRDDLVIATKCGIHWGPKGERIVDGSPARLRAECEESLRRLNTDRVDLLYLHAPDPRVPIRESAGALREVLEAGKTRAVGLSNADVEQLEEFSAECPLTAFQPHYNMLQREIELDTLPWCIAHNVAVVVYWPLMKGLLAGKLARDHTFAENDGRAKYPMFRGQEWQRNQDFLDRLRRISAEAGKTVAQVVINWTIHRPGITSALCGAKRPDQLRENAAADGWRLAPNHLSAIEEAIAARGSVESRSAV